MSEIITLRCKDCENFNCSLYPVGIYIPEDSLQGCTRKLSDLDFDKYIHYTEEVLPFLFINNNIDKFKEAYNFLQHIYKLPVGQKIGKNGKTLISR